MSFHVVGQKLIDIGSFVTNLDKWVAVGMFCIRSLCYLYLPDLPFFPSLISTRGSDESIK